jgi:hypothetical protein
MRIEPDYDWRENMEICRPVDFEKYLSQSESNRKKNLVENGMEIYKIAQDSAKRMKEVKNPYQYFMLKLSLDFLTMYDELKDSPQDQEYLSKLLKQVENIHTNSRGKYRKAYQKTKIKVIKKK